MPLQSLKVHILLQGTTTTVVTAQVITIRKVLLCCHMLCEGHCYPHLTQLPNIHVTLSTLQLWSDRGLNDCTAALCSSSERALPWGLMSHTGGTRYLLSKYNWSHSCHGLRVNDNLEAEGIWIPKHFNQIRSNTMYHTTALAHGTDDTVQGRQCSNASWAAHSPGVLWALPPSPLVETILDAVQALGISPPEPSSWCGYLQHSRAPLAEGPS